MPDRLSRDERSAHMARIRKVDTRPELLVRRICHALGYRFRLHRRDLPGTPDLVFPRLRKAILVQGCFWHQHPDPSCRLARQPKSRLDYWLPKLRRNRERDAVVRKQLSREGWEVLEVWECECQDMSTLEANIARFLGLPASRREIGSQDRAAPA